MPTAPSLPGPALPQANLTKSQNEFKIVLKELEDSLLARLSAASGNFLGDTALVENLETTKHTASEIEEKVSRAGRALSTPPAPHSRPGAPRTAPDGSGAPGRAPCTVPCPHELTQAPLSGFRCKRPKSPR